MIITLVIQNGTIALNLISEHKTEAKWVSGWPCEHNGASFHLSFGFFYNFFPECGKVESAFSGMVINTIHGSFYLWLGLC